MSISNVGITVTAWVPPSNYCPTTWQQAIQDAINNSTFAVTQPAAQVVMSNVKPTQTQNGTLWVETVGAPPFNGLGPGNSTPIQFWSYDVPLAAWVWPNPCPASGSERRLWFAAENLLWAYDGGDGTDPNVNTPYSNPPVANPSYVAPSASTGAMWMVDHTFDAQFILAPGNLAAVPSGTGPVLTLVAVGQTGGEQLHQLSITEIAPHIHTFGPVPTFPWLTLVNTPPGGGASQDIDWPTNQGNDGSLFTMNAGSAGGGVGDPLAGSPSALNPYSAAQYHNNMPPWIACFVIKRTARQYYRHA
jgi:hypothetical protein